MKVKLLKTLCFLAVAAAPSAHAGVIGFDDAWTALGEGSKPASYYLASDGVTISGAYYGLVGGIGNGDWGNWNLEGTNGSAFVGCNDGSNCKPTFSFNSTLSSLSVDAGIPGFGWSGKFTLHALLNGLVVASDEQSVSSFTEVGNWKTLSVAGVFDTVQISFASTGGGSFAYGLDNIVYTTDSGNPVPEPSTLALMAAGLALTRIRRRK